MISRRAASLRAPCHQAIGPPETIKFKYDMVPITANDPQSKEGIEDWEVSKIPEAQKRNAIQIHPDGECNGTLGCIGIQTFEGCKMVGKILTDYHRLRVKVELK